MSEDARRPPSPHVGFGAQGIAAPISGCARRSAWSQASATRHAISSYILTCAFSPALLTCAFDLHL
jgi:hypothetical protein